MTREIPRRMEVLLVEDNLEDANDTIQAVKHGRLQCRVTLVCDGEEAIRFLERDSEFAQAPVPDLILLDMSLPKMDGMQVLTKIRNDGCLKRIPVIVLTASQVHKALLQTEELRVDSYMSKPVDWTKFIEAVKTLQKSWFTEILLASAS